jgi:hypothetical protein
MAAVNGSGLPATAMLIKAAWCLCRGFASPTVVTAAPSTCADAPGVSMAHPPNA